MTSAAEFVDPGMGPREFTTRAAGDGGGAGRGFSTASGGARGSTYASFTYSYGVGGADGGLSSATGGGDWGQPGPTATRNWLYECGQAAGGAAGAAIITNGNTVTITSGNNPTNIKGAIV